MATGPGSVSRRNPGWFVAWIVGGVILSVLSAYLINLYFDFQTELTFQPVNPPPEVVRRRFLLQSIPYMQLVMLAYAAVGVWRFRRRGYLAVGCAVAFGCCTNMYMSVSGLGR